MTVLNTFTASPPTVASLSSSARPLQTHQTGSELELDAELQSSCPHWTSRERVMTPTVPPAHQHSSWRCFQLTLHSDGDLGPLSHSRAASQKDPGIIKNAESNGIPTGFFLLTLLMDADLAFCSISCSKSEVDCKFKNDLTWRLSWATPRSSRHSGQTSVSTTKGHWIPKVTVEMPSSKGNQYSPAGSAEICWQRSWK